MTTIPQPTSHAASAHPSDSARATKPNGSPKRPAPKTSGPALAGTLAALAKQAGRVRGAAEVAGLAQQLARGPLPRPGLVKLRDAVNALTANLREAKKTALARQLARVNRTVRRLERATR